MGRLGFEPSSEEPSLKPPKTVLLKRVLYLGESGKGACSPCRWGICLSRTVEEAGKRTTAQRNGRCMYFLGQLLLRPNDSEGEGGKVILREREKVIGSGRSVKIG